MSTNVRVRCLETAIHGIKKTQYSDMVDVWPTNELEPFFKLSFEEWLKGFAMATPMGFEPTIFGVTGRYV